MSTNKKYVGEEAALVLAAGIGAATPRTWDLTPDDLDSVTEEEQDGMVLMQFPTPARLKAALADIKTGDRLDASKIFEASAFYLTVMDVLRNEENGVVYCTVYASITEAGEGVAYYFHIRNETVDVVALPIVEPDPQKLSASAGGSSWKYGAIPNWGDVYQSAWFYTDHGSSSMPHDFKVGDIFRTPTLVPYGCPPSEASNAPADQPSANYAEGTIVGAGKIQNVPYLVVVGAARFGMKDGGTDKDAETFTAPGIFYITSANGTGSSTFWYVKFYPLLNKWKELEAKQGALSSSDDIKIGGEQNNTLTLTDRARHAVFDDLWLQAVRTAGSIDYTDTAAPYVCNGIGHTYEEAKYLYDLGHMRDGITNNFYRDTKIKVNLPTLFSGSVCPGRYTFMASKNLLKVDAPYFIPDIGAFRDCTALQSIRCYSPSVQSGSSQDVYLNCSALESITFTRMYELDLDLSYSPLLNLATYQLFVSKYSGSKAITIYVHPDVYTKLTDEANAQWYAVMTHAVNKKIAFATKE